MGRHNLTNFRRYPGTMPYGDSHISRKLFFGRDREANSLLHCILSEHLTVLYAKSGNGKTSLLKTLIFKGLRAHDYYPIVIRFNDSDKNPVAAFKSQCISIVQESDFDVNFLGAEKVVSIANINDKEEDLLGFIDRMEIWSRDDRLFTPIFVLDQFEEIFTLPHNLDGQKLFFKAISKVVRTKYQKWANPKIVISIREDFLGHLASMTQFIPTIFSNTFRLERLRMKNVEDIIRRPAKLEMKELKSPAFEFDDRSIETIKAFLTKDKLDKYPSSESIEIDPIQLQIICSAIEDFVIDELSASNSGTSLIREKDFGGQKGLEKIYKGYYDQQFQKLINKFGYNAEKIIAIRNVVERKLIANSKRVAVDYETFSEEEQKGVDYLLELKLIKEEIRGKNRLIELSHDALIIPILQKASQRRLREKREERQKKIQEKLKKEKKREQEERQRIKKKLYWIAGTLIALFMAISWFFAYQKIRSEKEEANFSLIKEIQRGNPTLSYQIGARDEFKRNKELSSYLEKTFGDNYSYMVKRFHIPDEVLFASKKSENEYHIISREGIYHFDKYGLMKEKKSFEGLEVIGVGKIEDNDYYLVFKEKVRWDLGLFKGEEPDRNIIVKDSRYETIDVFPAEDNPEHCDISSDGLYILLDKKLYKKNGISYTKVLEFDLDGDLYEINKMKIVNNYPKSARNQLKASKRFVIACRNSTITIHDVSNGEIKNLLHTNLDSDETEIHDMVYLPNENRIFAGGSTKIYYFNFDSSEKRYIDTNDGLVNLPIRHKSNILGKSIQYKYFMTGGIDGSIVICDFKGSTKSILLGLDGPVTFMDFIDEKTIISGDQAGNVIIWEMDIAKNIGSEMIALNPYEINSRLDEQHSFYDFYNLDENSSLEEVIEKLIAYTQGIPTFFIYWNDDKQTATLENSIKELKTLHDTIKNNNEFSSKKPYKKKAVYANYALLLDKELKLGQQEITYDKTISNEEERHIKSEEFRLGILEEKYKLKAERLLLDTLEIQNAINLAENLRRDFVKQIDSVQDYKLITNNLINAIKLMAAFEKKHPKHLGVKAKKGDLYGSISWYYLFTKEFEKTILMANNGISLDPNRNDWINTNLALGNLLSGKYKEAEVIYKKYKEDDFGNGRQRFKNAFLADFEDLEKAGIVNPDDQNVNKIKQMLLD